MQDRSPPARQNLLATHGRIIHLGQKATSDRIQAMSALTPTSDIGGRAFDVRLSAKIGSRPALFDNLCGANEKRCRDR